MKKILFPFLSLVLLAPMAFADDNASEQVYGDTRVAAVKLCDGLSTSDCLNVLQRQIAYINQQNTSSQIQDLQSQIADLKGRLDTVEHNYQQLTDQIKTQYADLDKRLQDLSAAKAPAAAATAAAIEQDKGTEKLEANERAMEQPQKQTVATSPSADEEKSYQKILGVLKKKDYVRATKMLQDFLTKYPHNFYTANAHLWLGDLYLLENQPDSAVAEYQALILSFPKSDKVSMAQLKLGFAFADQNNITKAQSQLRKVIRLYPGTKVAKLAKARLDQLKGSTK
ncbi:MAG: bamD 2 [Gammaproteobacteria bacterium]|jgi:tol-pal system protein YbgF|nr:bamD 2 [Gammaproteobacteria bacterium]